MDIGNILKRVPNGERTISPRPLDSIEISNIVHYGRMIPISVYLVYTEQLTMDMERFRKSIQTENERHRPGPLDSIEIAILFERRTINIAHSAVDRWNLKNR